MKIRGTGISSCSRVTNANLLEMQKLVEETELRVKQSLPRHVPLPNTSSHDKAIGSSSSDNYTNFPSHELKKRKGMVGPLEKAFNIIAREKLDGEIVRMFYTGGLSFHFARNPYYVRAFTNALPEIGPKNVVPVITDNASVFKAAGLLVESKFLHIFWTPCVVCTLNLALRSICSPSPYPKYDDIMDECGWIVKVSNDVFFIKNFIMNHSMRLSMFNDHSKLKLLSIADTRFASTIVMLKRFKQIKQGLEQIVISERWDIYKDDDMEKARSMKEKILNEYFWVDIDCILSFTSPIYEMLRMADTDKQCLHLVYE
ncbi:hypothetical protein Ddye_018989 [Dipteronia dyeriana]|uniref:DUF659 domain-containing protein n=1 Tax=Dipteronia dyeriana TaxID=168575 RepID=A0AAD9TWY5_9ROSI|nr:hypothetical protein Ddye_018989 [Dipteronia dyeriana]